MRKFLIRTDSSIEIGTGHVFRCLSLAEGLQKRGWHIIFLCRDFEGAFIEVIRSKGFEVIKLPADLSGVYSEAKRLKRFEGTVLKHASWLNASQAEDAVAVTHALMPLNCNHQDWLFVDHFALDARWESYFQSVFGFQLAVIDGQADRAHSAALLLDPTICLTTNKWKAFISSNTQLYQGLSYIPIHPRFFIAQGNSTVRVKLQTILIGFGGVDLNNYTRTALQALLELPISNIDVHVIVGRNYPHLSELETICQQFDFVFLHVQTDKVEALMQKADLAIGAGGSMAWERCLLYLPTLVAVIADNQRQQVACLEKQGIAINVGDDPERFSVEIKEVVMNLILNPDKLMAMSKRAYVLAGDVKPNAWVGLFE